MNIKDRNGFTKKKTISELEKKLTQSKSQLKARSTKIDFNYIIPPNGLCKPKYSPISFAKEFYQKLMKKEKLRDRKYDYLMPCYHINSHLTNK